MEIVAAIQIELRQDLRGALAHAHVLLNNLLSFELIVYHTAEIACPADPPEKRVELALRARANLYSEASQPSSARPSTT